MSYMDLVTRTSLANVSNYKKANRQNSDIKYIVIHYTANDGDTDEANANYFKVNNRQASAHFFVDDDSITLSVELNNIAWHCGGNVYNDVKKTGGGKYHNICTNSNSIGIEMCDTNRNGTYDLSVKTRENVIKLVRELMKEFNIDINHVIRHFDVTGKYCPRYFCPPYGSNDEWNKFKADIMSKVETSNNKEEATVKSIDMSEKQIWDYLLSNGLTKAGVAGLMGNLYAESGLKSNNLQNNGNNKLGLTDKQFTDKVDNRTYSKETFIRDGYGYGLAQWTYWSRKQALYEYVVSKGSSIGCCKTQLEYLLKELVDYKDVINILKTTDSVREASDIVLLKFERPADQSEDVQLKRAKFGQVYYDKFVDLREDVKVNEHVMFNTYKVRITASALNYRQGPGVNYKVNGVIYDKGIYTIVDESNGWGKLKSGAGWISLKYTSKIN